MFVPDTPISTANEDLLNRAGFARKLGETIRDWDRAESIVIALYGPWGSGKTSMLNIAVEHMKNPSHDRSDHEPPVIIRFNPWNFSEQSQLLDAFFRSLFAGIKDLLPERGKDLLWGKLQKFSKALGVLEELPSVGGIFRGVRKTIVVLAPEETLDKLKSELVQSFRSLKRRVVIVIDDIDRLTQQEIRQIFQLIKINADFPNTIYLVAFDRSVVERALTTEQGVSGREYLEKIVQVGFELPAADPAFISGLVFTELDRVLSALPIGQWDSTRWGNLYHAGFKSLFTTIRDVKRYMNSLAFNLKIVSDEVNTIDFIGLEAIRVFMPEVYQGIAGNKALFTGTGSLGFGVQIDREAMRTQYEQIFSKTGEQSPIAKSICQQLFPQMRMAYENTLFGPEWQGHWRRERRICAEDMFDVYFILGTPKGDVAKYELDRITRIAGDRDALLEIFRRMSEEKRIARLLDLLPDIVDDLADNALVLCEALLILGDELPDEQRGFFDMGTDLRIARLIYQCLIRREPQVRCDWMLNQIRNGPSTFIPTHIISLDEPGNQRPRDNALFDDDCRRRLKEACIQRFVAQSQTGHLWKAKKLNVLLFRWKDWTNDQQPLREFIQQTASSRESLLDLIAGFAYPVHSQYMSDYVSRETWEINLNHVTEFLERERLETFISSIGEQDLTDMPERQKRGYLALVRAMRRQERDRNEEDDDLDD